MISFHFIGGNSIAKDNFSYIFAFYTVFRNMDGNSPPTEVPFENDTVLCRDLGQANPDVNRVSIDTFKETIMAEVVKALSQSKSLHNLVQGPSTAISIAGAPSNDHKRSHDLQSQMSDDSISLHPIDEDVFPNDIRELTI